MKLQDLIKLNNEKVRLEVIFKIQIQFDAMGYQIVVPYSDTYMVGWDQNDLFCPYTLIDALAFSINDMDYPVSKQDVIDLSSFLNLNQDELLSKIPGSIRNEAV